MKDVPDIDPEVFGLLEEIVADPRSAMRLVPRKALRSWFDTNEVARASEISTTRAERHLIEEHRESLAALLCEAAWIAYWKAPVLAHRPVGEDGMPYHPGEREPQWKRRAQRRMATDESRDDGVQLVRECLAGVGADRAHELALASLSLVPCDRTRCYVALTLPWDRPRTAARFFRRLSVTAWPANLRPQALLSLAARQCSLGQFGEALDAYRLEAELSTESMYGRVYALNLCCFLGERDQAQNAASELALLVRAYDPRLPDLATVARSWMAARSVEEQARCNATYQSIVGPGSEVARVIGSVR